MGEGERNGNKRGSALVAAEMHRTAQVLDFTKETGGSLVT